MGLVLSILLPIPCIDRSHDIFLETTMVIRLIRQKSVSSFRLTIISYVFGNIRISQKSLQSQLMIIHLIEPSSCIPIIPEMIISITDQNSDMQRKNINHRARVRMEAREE